ncbi:hypothetical protein EDB81DRAFT_4461 [Dactylonectria macrodidyma]|uniref:Uncharacterized protein n=1 Tax=Dactylonectria macrodidyma TaxID=307937 RepID=A0A9P9FRN9_9HYPO|nr:hypothetical protein EDB81DRAFT_4461 [Dactylonectria macrodidyma]
MGDSVQHNGEPALALFCASSESDRLKHKPSVPFCSRVWRLPGSLMLDDGSITLGCLQPAALEGHSPLGDLKVRVNWDLRPLGIEEPHALGSEPKDASPKNKPQAPKKTNPLTLAAHTHHHSGSELKKRPSKKTRTNNQAIIQQYGVKSPTSIISRLSPSSLTARGVSRILPLPPQNGAFVFFRVLVFLFSLPDSPLFSSA